METKSSDNSTAKDHLANQRTFLAWIRTSIGLMAFGFVLERFALFINQVELLLQNLQAAAPHVPSRFHGAASLVGVLLVAFGAFLSLLAFFEYRSTAKKIDQKDYQPSMLLNIVLTLSVLIVGIFLVIYLKNPL
jgi:putative membrane protein